MKNKTILITGGASGIGLALVEKFTTEGSNVYFIDSNGLLGKQVEKEFQEKGKSVTFLEVDIREESQVQHAIQSIPSKLDVLINNAGYGLKGRFINHTSAAEVDLLNVLVTAVLRLTHAALPNMRNAISGYIINVGSVAGWLSGSTYSAAKAWVNAFSEHLNVDLAKDGITVTSLAPGFTHTEFHQRGGMKIRAVPEFFWEKASDVVKAGWAGALRGDAIVISGKQYRTIVFLARHLPRKLVRRI